MCVILTFFREKKWENLSRKIRRQRRCTSHLPQNVSLTKKIISNHHFSRFLSFSTTVLIGLYEQQIPSSHSITMWLMENSRKGRTPWGLIYVIKSGEIGIIQFPSSADDTHRMIFSTRLFFA